MESIIDDVRQLNKVAERIVANAGDIKVWFFKGDLGAGKTALIQEICKILDVEDVVVSPSFALVNVYNNGKDKKEIYHIDLYRLKNTEEAIDLGIEDYLYSGNYCFIEWPQIIEDIAPGVYLEIEMEILPDSKRKIKINKKKKRLTYEQT